MANTSGKTVGLIPARLQSSRLPRKAMLDICGLPMIVHVFKRCLLAKTLDEVYVATDSKEIYQCVLQYGGKAIMTSDKHQTGTDRIAEAAKKLDCEIVVNIQGDEALVNPSHIDAVVSAMKDDPGVKVAILINPYYKRNSPSDIKVVIDTIGDVLYLSRTDIPSDARSEKPQLFKAYHIIPFKKEFLLEYAAMEQTPLEKIEFNEYLRILENGYKIRTVQVESEAISVDTEEDLNTVRLQMEKDPFFPCYA
ncbi:3-deoxy-manno-octulosonate cytidylyltransferase [Candidatus Riflebacteria bacterium]